MLQTSGAADTRKGTQYIKWGVAKANAVKIKEQSQGNDERGGREVPVLHDE